MESNPTKLGSFIRIWMIESLLMSKFSDKISISMSVLPRKLIKVGRFDMSLLFIPCFVVGSDIAYGYLNVCHGTGWVVWGAVMFTGRETHQHWNRLISHLREHLHPVMVVCPERCTMATMGVWQCMGRDTLTTGYHVSTPPHSFLFQTKCNLKTWIYIASCMVLCKKAPTPYCNIYCCSSVLQWRFQLEGLSRDSYQDISYI